MAKTSTTTIGVSVIGDSVNETFTPAAIVNTAAPAGGPISVALSSGDNTITVPSGAVSMMLIPPSTSTVVKKLKGIGGDTGFTVGPAALSMISLPTGTGTVLINAASSETISIHWL
jgi:hypothetical protein